MKANEISATVALAALIAALALVSAVGPGAPSGSAQAEPPAPAPDPPAFGMIGITRGETLRLNVVHTGYYRRGDTHDPAHAPAPQRVLLAVFDSEGRAVARSAVTLEVGQSAHLDVVGEQLIPTSGARLELRAVVRAERDANEIQPCVMPTVEVFNSMTGRNTNFYPGRVPNIDL